MKKPNKDIPDLRIRETDVLYLLEIYKQVTKTNNGRIVFLSGDEGSGKTATLTEIVKRLGREEKRPKIIHYYLEQKGNYIKTKQSHPIAKSIMTTAAISTPLASAIIPAAPATVPYLLSLGGTAIQAGLSGLDIKNLLMENNSEDNMFNELITFIDAKSNGNKPAVFIYDDFYKLNNNGFLGLLNYVWFKQQLLKKPVFIILVMNDADNISSGNSNSLWSAMLVKKLTGEGYTEWHNVSPVLLKELQEWAVKPGNEHFLKEIVNITNGNPAMIIELWSNLKHAGVIIDDWEGGWKIGEPVKDITYTMETIIRERISKLINIPDKNSDEVTYVLSILSCGVLEGRSFTAEAVAEALGIDKNELIDYLDDNLEWEKKKDKAIMKEDSVELNSGGSKTYIWKYYLLSDLLWSFLDILNQNENPLFRPLNTQILAKRLADALVRIYRADILQILHVLVRLYSEGNDPERVEYYKRLADENMSGINIYKLALFVVDDYLRNKAGWVYEDFLKAEYRLVDLGGKLINRFPMRHVLFIFETAYQINLTFTKNKPKRAEELVYLSWCYNYLNNLKKAVDAARQALVIYRKLKNYKGCIDALNDIAVYLINDGKLDEARTYLDSALVIGEKYKLIKNKIATLNRLVSVDIDQGKLDEAAVYLSEARSLLEINPDIFEEALVYFRSGIIAGINNQYKEATNYFLKTLNAANMSNDLKLECQAALHLGAIYRKQSDIASSWRYSFKSFQLAYDNEYIKDEILILAEMAYLLYSTGKYPENILKLIIFSIYLSSDKEYSRSGITKVLNYYNFKGIKVTEKQAVRLFELCKSEYAKDRGWTMVLQSMKPITNTKRE